MKNDDRINLFENHYKQLGFTKECSYYSLQKAKKKNIC